MQQNTCRSIGDYAKNVERKTTRKLRSETCQHHGPTPVVLASFASGHEAARRQNCTPKCQEADTCMQCQYNNCINVASGVFFVCDGCCWYCCMQCTSATFYCKTCTLRYYRTYRTQTVAQMRNPREMKTVIAVCSWVQQAQTTMTTTMLPDSPMQQVLPAVL